MKTMIQLILTLFSLQVATGAEGSNESWVSRTVKYDPKDIVTIGTRVRFTTLVVLPQGEKIVDFVVGDRDFWVVEGIQNFAYIKPSKMNASTNVTLITAAGNVYSLVVTELTSQPARNPDLKVFFEPTTEGRIQNAQRFVSAEDIEHLQDALARVAQQAEKEKASFRAQYPQLLQFDYEFERNKKPFNVSAIYHDGTFTYIRSSASEMPALYEMKDDKPNLVDFSMEDGLYIVPKVLDRGWLSIGKKQLSFKRVR